MVSLSANAVALRAREEIGSDKICIAYRQAWTSRKREPRAPQPRMVSLSAKAVELRAREETPSNLDLDQSGVSEQLRVNS